MQASDMAFLRGVKVVNPTNQEWKRTRRIRVLNNFYDRLKGYKRNWAEHLERIPELRLATQIRGYKPIGHRSRV